MTIVAGLALFVIYAVWATISMVRLQSVTLGACQPFVTCIEWYVAFLMLVATMLQAAFNKRGW